MSNHLTIEYRRVIKLDNIGEKKVVFVGVYAEDNHSIKEVLATDTFPEAMEIVEGPGFADRLNEALLDSNIEVANLDSIDYFGGDLSPFLFDAIINAGDKDAG